MYTCVIVNCVNFWDSNSTITKFDIMVFGILMVDYYLVHLHLKCMYVFYVCLSR